MPAKTWDLNKVVKGCVRRRRNSQRMLFEHFFGYAMSISLRYSKNREEAEEILNTGFLKALNKIEQYDVERPFRLWLRQILVHTAIDYYRRQQKYPVFLELQTVSETAEAVAEMPILEDEDVLPVLQKLSPAYRIVFNMYVMEGYAHEEIGEMLGITASASRSNLARAKEKLRKIMISQGYQIKKAN